MGPLGLSLLSVLSAKAGLGWAMAGVTCVAGPPRQQILSLLLLQKRCVLLLAAHVMNMDSQSRYDDVSGGACRRVLFA